MISIKFGSSSDLENALAQAAAQASAQTAWVELNRPLTTLGLNASIYGQMERPTPPGGVLTIGPVSLPIGMDIKAVVCAPVDVDRWAAINFTLGTMNLINPQGCVSGSNLAAFHPLTPHEDKIATWILSKTKVDVQVMVQLQNATYRYDASLPTALPPPPAPKKRASKKATTAGASAASVETKPQYPNAGRGVEAIFLGFSILAFQEEQICAIQTRIEPGDRNVGCAELIHMFRKALGEVQTRQQVHYVQSKDPVQTKVARVVAAAGNLGDAVKSLFGGPERPPSGGHPSYVPTPTFTRTGSLY